jgi:hypothetical protein
MKHTPSWEANSYSASQEISRLLWKSKVHYFVRNTWRFKANTEVKVLWSDAPYSVAVGYQRFGRPLTLITEAARSSETSVSNHHTTRCNNPENHELNVWVPRHESVLGSGGIAPRILELGSRRRWERAPGTHCVGGWVGPRASLDTVVRRKNFEAPAGTRTHDRPTCSPAPCDWALPRARDADSYRP